MSDAENDNVSAGQKRPSALRIGPRKKAYVESLFVFHGPVLMFDHNRCTTDPLVHHGRHFGRTVHAMTNVSALVNNALARLVELEDNPDKELSRE